MPQFDVTAPDGKVYTVNAPDGASQDDAVAYVRQNVYGGKDPEAALAPSGRVSPAIANDAISQGARDNAVAGIPESLLDSAKNVIGGGVRGAGSIGATILDLARSAPVRSAIGEPLRQAIPQNLRLQPPDDLATLPHGAELRKGMDAGLQSLGADPDSFLYGGSKLGAEVAGTAGAGGLLAKGLQAGAGALGLADAPLVSSIMNGLQTGGFRLGAQAPVEGALATAGRALSNAAIRTGTGAATGAVTAGMVNPEDAGMGAVIGGALPGITKAVGMAGSALRGVGRAVSPSMARQGALETIADTIGKPNVQQAAADMQTYFPKGAEDIPLSAAAVTQNPALAQLEQASRLRASVPWYEFDQGQKQAVFDNVMKATGDAEDLGARYAQRQQNWTDAWNAAQQAQKPKLWAQRMTQFGNDLDAAMQSGEASNPDVLKVLNGISNEMDRVGPNFSPSHLQQIRANLSGAQKPLSDNVYKSAPRDSAAVKSLISEMDDILNTTTGGQWQKVLSGYAQDSNAVRAAKAAQKVRNAFIDADTGRVLGNPANPDLPNITGNGLSRAMDAARLPDKSLALSGEANQRLQATLDALRDQNIVQNIKRSATAGGGSDTASNLMAQGLGHGRAPSLLLQGLRAIGQVGTAKTDAQMAKLLANPDELARQLQLLSNKSGPGALGAFAQGAYRATPLLATQGE